MTVAELRAFLGGHLPDYMVPAFFVALPALPLTPSGKIDRRALPALDPAQFARDAVHVRPANEGEQLVAEIWAGLLGVPRVGRDDNFFHLGGHSLLATRVIARLRARTTLEVPLRALFEHPTLAAFTGAVALTAGDAEMLNEVVRSVREVEAMTDAEAAERRSSGG